MCLEEVTSHGNAKRWFAVCTGEQTKVRDQLDQLTAGVQAGNSELAGNESLAYYKTHNKHPKTNMDGQQQYLKYS